MIGVIEAMTSEAEILLKDMQIKEELVKYDKKVYIGTAYGKEIVLILCGVGKVNAACATQMAVDLYHADKIVNFGVAGGINDNTEIGSVYQIEKAVEYDFDLADINQTTIGTLEEFTENYMPLSTSDSIALPLRKLATGDRFNNNPADYLLLRDDLKADIRDMEGGAIVQTAIHCGVPVYEWKAISDKAMSGSSFEVYFQNKLRSLDNLHKLLPELFGAL